ncbi:MAG: putative DNA binding domain-containing protein [Methanocorpusculum sp.]|nr:putative DNA binding domain-containing protein [Methanocorpusculum sp.]
MALPVSIERLLSGNEVESTRKEYKLGWNPEKILHTICAFANDIENLGGGYILLGVEEKDGMPTLPVKGIDKHSIDTINKKLLNLCNKIEPRYIPVVETVEYTGKLIIVIWAYGGVNRPYKCPISLSETKPVSWAYYIRKLASTIQANSKDEKELFSLSETVPFDDRINNKAEVEDLRSSLISSYLLNVNSELYEESLTLPLREIVKKMRIADGPNEYLKPLNVGLMFFHEKPENFFKYARIEIVDKPDETGIGMTEKYFTGPLDKQLRDALDFIKNYTIAEKIIKYPNRAEADRIFNYPYAAIEEAVTNAVHHKSYQIPEPITITITPENIEILSLPGPDKSISLDDIHNLHIVSSRYRNRRIGEFLKELKLVEGRNTGIPTMIKSLKQNGSENPVFETDEDRSYFRVSIPIHSAYLKKENTENISPLNDPKQNYKKIRRTKEQLKQEILNTLASGPLSASEVAVSLGYSSARGNSFVTAVHELIEENHICYLLPEKKKANKQKLMLKQ